MTSQEAILDKERRSRDWALQPSNIKKFGRWAWNDQGSRKRTTSQMEEKPGDCGLLETKQRKCSKEKVINYEKGCCVNYVRNTKQDADVELAMGSAAQSSLVTSILQRCLGNAGGKAWLRRVLARMEGKHWQQQLTWGEGPCGKLSYNWKPWEDSVC